MIDNGEIIEKRQRIAYIDIAKGIAIFLMVVGHSYSEYNSFLTYIYSFHMPFFFLISGILYGYKVQNGGHLILNISRKVKTLLLPYAIWGALYKLFLSVFQIIGGDCVSDTLLKSGKEFIELNSGAMWFLPVMFIAFLIFLLIYKIKKGGYVVFVAIMFIGILAPQTNNPYLDTLYRAFIGSGFLAIGFYGCKIFQYRISIPALGVLFIINLFLAFINGKVDLLTRVFHNFILYVIVACLGSYLLLSFSRLLTEHIKSQKWLEKIEYAGRSTIEILCLHMFVIETYRLLDYKIMGNILPQLGIFEGIIIAFIVYLLLVLVLPYVSRYIAFTFGKIK